MKRILTIKILILSCCLTFNLYGQEQTQSEDTVSGDGFTNLYAGIYSLSRQFNDPLISRMALYHLLLSAPNKTAILDSLALNYYDAQQWFSVALISQENLKLNSDNKLALELGALAYERIGVRERALENYETLFLKNNSTSTLYRIAFLQYELKRYKEASASCDILLGREDIIGQNIYFPKQDNTQMEVSMKSALLNLKGLIAKDEGNTTQAKEFFLEAIKETPGFEIAQKNLAETNKQGQE